MLVLEPSRERGSRDAPPEILTLLSEAVRDLLEPSVEQGLNNEQCTLATEVLGLLEALAWNASPELANRYESFPCM